MKEVTITEDQLKNMLDKIKELEEAKQLIKLLKEEVGFAERGYTQKGWVKTYAGGKPNYCTPEVISNGENVTPEVTPDVDDINMTQERVDETAKREHEWVGLTDEEIQAERHKLDQTAGWTYDHFARAIEAKLKEKNT